MCPVKWGSGAVAEFLRRRFAPRCTRIAPTLHARLRLPSGECFSAHVFYPSAPFLRAAYRGITTVRPLLSLHGCLRLSSIFWDTDDSFTPAPALRSAFALRCVAYGAAASGKSQNRAENRRFCAASPRSNCHFARYVRFLVIQRQILILSRTGPYSTYQLAARSSMRSRYLSRRVQARRDSKPSIFPPC